jgi:hypothetical protein
MNYARIEDIQQRARQGDLDAMMALARVFDQEGRHDVALEWLRKAGQAGHAPSLLALGARLLIGKAAPRDYKVGQALLAAAAEAGNGEAAALVAVCAAAAIGRAQSWTDALDYLQLAGELGWWRAREQLAFLTPDANLRTQLLDHNPLNPIPWKAVRASIDLAPWFAMTAPEQQPFASRIAVFRNFLSAPLRAWVIARAQPKLEAVRVVNTDSFGAQSNDMRTNTGMGFSFIDTDVIMQIVHARIAFATNIPSGCHEPTNVLHYAVGQRYEPHYDFFNTDVPELKARAEAEGQRVATFLIYLNDEYEGGETDFPRLNWRFRGAAGDALFFYNTDANRVLDKNTLHAGLAPTRGEKWLLSKWIRDRGVPLV